MSNLQNKHGRKKFYLVGEGFKPSREELNKDNVPHFLIASMVRDRSESLLLEEKHQFKFGRMFKQTRNIRLDYQGLIELGRVMIQAETQKENTDLPAGYTFLGQFIDHDLSFDSLRKGFPGVNDFEDPIKILSRRSPSLDLDSLYGYYPYADEDNKFDQRLYEDGVRFRIGCTSKSITQGIRKRYPYDLPRPSNSKIAIIADERNDENLPLAQTHLGFLKFHNAVVKHLENEKPELREQPKELFRQARETVVKHYQWIILHDFLQEILDKSILTIAIASAENGGRGPGWLADDEAPYMPVEFAGAAFRLGHSLLQDAYEWNVHFDSASSGNIASFDRLFEFTGPDGLGMFDNLPGNWIIDWRRFYDFTRYGIPRHARFNRSRKIDPFIGNKMKFLPEFASPHTPAHMRNLAVRNLIRGRFLELQTGQEIAELIGRQLDLQPDEFLTSTQILTGDDRHKEVLQKYRFHEQTPLWYYILKEAEIFGEGGKRLGPVGSFIIAQTFVKLIQRSEISIFKDNWRPTKSDVQLPVETPSEKEYEMADLLMFAHDLSEEVLNPSEAESPSEC